MSQGVRILIGVAALLGIAFGITRFWQAAKSGRIVVEYNRSGKETIYHRSKEPFRYWLSLFFILCLILIPTFVLTWAFHDDLFKPMAQPGAAPDANTGRR
jgi:hypothetical protein